MNVARANRPKPPTPAVPGVPKPPAPAQAPIPAGPAGVTPDAEYLADQARRSFERKQAADRIKTEQQQDVTDTQEAIRRLLARGDDDRRGITEGANKQGLFYSGHLGKSLDDYQAGVMREQSDLNLEAQRRADARSAAVTALDQGAPIEEASALASLAARNVDRDSRAGALGLLAPIPAAPKPKPKPKPVVVASKPQRTTRRRRR